MAFFSSQNTLLIFLFNPNNCPVTGEPGQLESWGYFQVSAQVDLPLVAGVVGVACGHRALTRKDELGVEQCPVGVCSPLYPSTYGSSQHIVGPYSPGT